MTALELIEAALRKCEIKNRGYDLTGDEIQDALQALNVMLSNWSANHIIIPYYTKLNFTLTINTASYTIGASGAEDWTTTAVPTVIDDAYILDSNNVRYELEPIHRWEWRDEPVETTDARPTHYYYERTDPNGTIRFNSKPQLAEAFHFFAKIPFTRFSSVSTEDSFPQEYEAPVIYNLAVHLAPEFGNTVSDEVAALAGSTLQNAGFIHNAQDMENDSPVIAE